MPACSDGATPGDAASGPATSDAAGGDGKLGEGLAEASAGETVADAEGAEVETAVAPEVLAEVAPKADSAPDVPKDVQMSETEKLTACLLKNCTAQITTCLGDETCGTAVGCLAGCNGDSGCMLNCGNGLSSDAQQMLLAVANCAVQQGCVQIIKSPNCGNGKCDFGEQLSCAQDCGTPSAVCGDGKCDVTEMLTCDKDCKATNPCGNGTCDSPIENPLTCPKDCPAPKCGDGKCATPWETVLTCPGDCTPTLGCGDGKCDLATESTATCPLDCNSLQCGDGTCSSPLENPYTCAKDCPLPKCGDGKCDGPFESAVACPADCSAGGGKLPNVTGCIATSCGKESLACVGDFAGCGGASLCVGGCKDYNCVVGCGKKLTGASAQKFQALQDCIAKNCVSP
ncbi:MAG: hypothetical protein FJ100_10205 [Deltaproteobacteria bacterium]|nr:hypothetical protein [Deltaproteobacteria bacterium]